MTGLKQYQLTKEALDALRTDAMLAGMVATLLGVTPRYMDVLRLKNNVDLTQTAVVELISKTLSKKPKEILQEIKIQKSVAA